MKTPEIHALQESMNKIQRDMDEINRQQKMLFYLVILVAICAILPPALPFALAAFIFAQIIDAVHQRRLRKRHEQRVFQQLSGRI